MFGVSVVLAHCRLIELDAVIEIVAEELLAPSEAVMVAL